ncbi:MAG: PQQ-binding-like beta-propeller repeat protein, partial [Opitutaceae bacterium]
MGRRAVRLLLRLAMFIIPIAGSRAQDGSVQWRYTVAQQGGISFSAPALTPDGTTVYVGATDRSLGRVLAVSREGGPKWMFERLGFIDASPALAADGTIYIGYGFGRLYALTPGDRSASVKWERTLGTFLTSSPAIGSEGVIYVGADTQLHALAPEDGSVLWSFPTGGLIESSPAIGADGTVYFGSYDKNLYAVSRDGTRKWAFSTAGVILGSPAIGADGTIYIGSADQRLYAVSPDGTQQWNYFTNGAIQASPVLAADGTIYAVADTSVYALRPGAAEERLRWKASITPPAGSVSTPAIRGDGTIIFGADDGIVRALNPHDGSEKWRRDTQTNDLIESSPIISPDGSIYIGSFPYLFKLNGNGSPLSAYSSWPAFRRDIRHTGRAFQPNTGGQLVNISTRAQAGAGRNLIAGFVVQAAPERARAYLIRAVGPGLQSSNVAGFMPDPRLQLFSGAASFRINDNWVPNDESNGLSLSETATAVQAFPLQSGSAD